MRRRSGCDGVQESLGDLLGRIARGGRDQETVAVPSVFERNLQCQPVRGVNTREECHWSHTCKSFKRAGVGTNCILECNFLSKNAHRTEPCKHTVHLRSGR
jgi:hypothetical protein